MPLDAQAVPVAEIMSRKVIGVPPESPVRHAMELMVAHGISALPVLDGDVCAGMLSARDLMEIAYEFDKEITRREAVDDVMSCLLGWEEVSQALGDQLVSDVMTKSYHSVPPGAVCTEAARLMTSAGIHRLPVIDPATGSVVGIVSTTDVVRAVAEQG